MPEFMNHCHVHMFIDQPVPTLSAAREIKCLLKFNAYFACKLITCRKPIEATRSPREVDFVLWWMLLTVDASSLGAISYMDCIGKDKYGEERKKNFKLAGENGMNRCHLMSIKKSQEIGHQLGYCL
ncbi:uncharacterized protein LOC130730050 isoform X2 [Lotus japonicus]|uniref:uncharacterized protein LOC130723087 isoform X2 n=1 Tax=Lotus japonicus TaxID=34305 RepID=UPI00258256CE|nr:uncharacterized protein LOC130723087 isoform X2 [Lotus japonicus]XP_057437915.1 uncharacterized protein LOC130730050 isoform X2 [Lotus japonicus]